MSPLKRMENAAKTSLEAYRTARMTKDQAKNEERLADCLDGRLNEIINELGRMQDQTFYDEEMIKSPLYEMISAINACLCQARREMDDLGVAISYKAERTTD